jgi:hypothetical protein
MRLVSNLIQIDEETCRLMNRRNDLIEEATKNLDKYLFDIGFRYMKSARIGFYCDALNFDLYNDELRYHRAVAVDEYLLHCLNAFFGSGRVIVKGIERNRVVFKVVDLE